MKDLDRLIPQKDAAAMLGISPVTLRVWIRRGDLPAVRLGKRRVFVRASALSRFVANAAITVEADGRRAHG